MTSEREATKRLRNYQEMSEDDLDQEEGSSDHSDINNPLLGGPGSDLSEEDAASLPDEDGTEESKRRSRKVRSNGRNAAHGGPAQFVSGGHHPSLNYRQCVGDPTKLLVGSVSSRFFGDLNPGLDSYTNEIFFKITGTF
jgi:hypothetical protein